MKQKSNLRDKGKVEEISSVVESIYKITCNLRDKGKVEEISSVVESIYKITCNLRDKGKVEEISSVVESIYKITCNLRDKGKVEEISSVVESIYKITCNLRDKGKVEEISSVVESIYSYMDGLKRVFQSEYFASNSNEILSGIERMSSFGQLKSKLWLKDTLEEKKLFQLGNVFLCAGWYGMLPLFLLCDTKLIIQRLFNFERDPLSVKISEDLNRLYVQENWKFKAVLKDILDLNYESAEFETLKANGKSQTLVASPDTIINTSCEHIKNFSLWWSQIPAQKLLVLQSNNFFQHEDHSNCVSSLDEFKKQAPMSFLYTGELDMGRYKRFMLIGYKRQPGL